MDTGITVLQDYGVLKACSDRQKLCGYACCKFTAGNWIMLLPNEYQHALQQGLKHQHLNINAEKNAATCHRPCGNGDLKPIDCSWYPLFPANETATQFLVADHRKCPIPNHQLIDKMWSVHHAALDWEQKNAGSLAYMVSLSRDFVGYQPYPYKIEAGQVMNMTDAELQALELAKPLPENYVCHDWTSTVQGYSASTTPDD